MSTISPIGGTNISYPIQGNVIPTVQKNLMATDTISFSGNQKSDEKKSHTGLWVLGGLAVAVGLGIIFRKNISEFASKIAKTGTFDGAIDNLLKNAEKKETYKFDDVVAYARDKFPKEKVPTLEHGLVYRMDDVMKQKYGIESKEAILLGYQKEGKKFVFTKIVTCEKLDDKFLKLLGDKSVLKLV